MNDPLGLAGCPRCIHQQGVITGGHVVKGRPRTTGHHISVHDRDDGRIGRNPEQFHLAGMDKGMPRATVPQRVGYRACTRDQVDHGRAEPPVKHPEQAFERLTPVWVHDCNALALFDAHIGQRGGNGAGGPAQLLPGQVRCAIGKHKPDPALAGAPVQPVADGSPGRLDHWPASAQ